MKPAFAYYGGKTRLAPWIVSLMPHRVYVEPFAGSAAILFAKPPSAHEVINDVDGDITNFFDLLRSRRDDLELACRLTPYSRAEFAHAQAVDLADIDDPIERARLWWIRSTQSFAQTGSRNTGWSISIAQSCNRPHQIYNRLGRFGALADRLSTVFVENDDALRVIDRYGVDDAVIYADPCYLDVTRSSYRDKNGWARRPAGDYRHEFATEADHRALAARLHATPATVLLSGYPSDLYDDLYGSWWRCERHIRRASSNGLSHGNHRAVEVIWSNRPLQGVA